MKLLVNTPNDLQELIEVGEGGGYFDVSRVLWDERIDGAIPDVTVGGMVRQGNQLVFDSQLFADYEAKLAAAVAPPAPTKEQLMAELAALTSKIQACSNTTYEMNREVTVRAVVDGIICSVESFALDSKLCLQRLL